MFPCLAVACADGVCAAMLPKQLCYELYQKSFSAVLHLYDMDTIQVSQRFHPSHTPKHNCHGRHETAWLDLVNMCRLAVSISIVVL